MKVCKVDGRASFLSTCVVGKIGCISGAASFFLPSFDDSEGILARRERPMIEIS